MMRRAAQKRETRETRKTAHIRRVARQTYESRANALDDDANANANAFEAYIILRR